MSLIVRILLAGVLSLPLWFVCVPASAQSRVTVRVAENFRREPQGMVLGRLEAGAALTVVDREDRWIEAEVEGWIWLASLQGSDRTGFDLVVSAAGGENLRRGPSGEIIGRLERGTLLEEVDRQPGWAHVRRRGWIWSASLTETGAAGGAGVRAGAQRSAPDAGTGTARASQSSTTSPNFQGLGSAPAGILSAPDGDTLAVVRPGGEVEVLARQGNWARVRMEGWAWIPEGAAAPTGSGGVVSSITPETLSRGGGNQVGRVVSWSLQFISLERAEQVRTDFLTGEPFLLTRYGSLEGPYVYVAVPRERLSEVQGLVPLESIVVTGRVRTAASSLTGAPILDLLSIERRAGRR